MKGLVCLCLLSIASVTLGCYEECIQKFSMEMNRIQSTNNSAVLTSSFCKAVRHQVECLNVAMTQCTPQQQSLIRNMVTVFIQPDYERTCGGANSVAQPSSTGGASTMGYPFGSGSFGNPTGSGVGGATPVPMPGGAGMFPISPSSTAMSTGQSFLVCTQKLSACTATFNRSLADAAMNNVTLFCQGLKQYTICFLNLVSSGCGTWIPRLVVDNMQQQYGGLCSNDAQANTNIILQCTDQTLECYTDFNNTFIPAVRDTNLIEMCSSIDNYTNCMHMISRAEPCAQFAAGSLSGLNALKTRHTAYCGDDNGRTATQCVESFQDCFVPFNMTFFLALHVANLTMACSALSTYTSCISRLSPSCSQQMGHMLQSAQILKMQYQEKCHPNLLKLLECEQVGYCSQMFIKNFAARLPALPNTAQICDTIGDYFPCVERALDTCKLPQSTTEVEFGALGTVMHNFCDDVSKNQALLRCPAFLKCTTAVMVSFQPNLKNMFEASTWCTFLQLNIGCAEHALQSSGCFLESNEQLQQHILEMDQERMRTCERGLTADETNLVDQGKQQGKENTGSMVSMTVHLLIAPVFLSFHF